MSDNRRSHHKRRVTFPQLEELWEILNSHRDIAMGYNKTTEARQLSKIMWQTVAARLNADKDGANKTWRAWNSYWVDYKSKLKKLVVANRAQEKTGGAVKTMSDLEKKFVGLLGEDFGVRVEPTLYIDVQDTNNRDQLMETIPIKSESSNSSLSLPEPSYTISCLTPPPPIPSNTPHGHHTAWPPQHQGAGTATRTPRRRRTRITQDTMMAQKNRRALVKASERRQNIEEARNVILEQKLDSIRHAIDTQRNDIKTELQALTAAINSLNDTIQSCFQKSEP